MRKCLFSLTVGGGIATGESNDFFCFGSAMAKKIKTLMVSFSFKHTAQNVQLYNDRIHRQKVDNQVFLVAISINIIFSFTILKMFTCVVSDQMGLVDESQCRRCSPGFYCSEMGLTAVSGPCLPGQRPVFKLI